MIREIGILGGGQLGRMMVPPAASLGFNVTVLDPAIDCPAAQVGASQIRGSITDQEDIEGLAEVSDVVTWEVEHVGIATLIELHNIGYNVQADPNTLSIIQDKVTQKRFLQGIGVPLAPYSEALSEEGFLGGGPFIVKSRQGGFDGRGNLVVDSFNDPRIAIKFGNQSTYAEQIVPFDKELSVVAARDMLGNVVTYPTVETIHQDNICQTVLSPANISPRLARAADEAARVVMHKLRGAGVAAIEMFAIGDDVLVNEIAPRVHNSGHHTIEANATSQFEQHIRAITGLPLGSTAQRSPAAAMVNVIGTREGPLDRTGLAKALQLPDTHVHLYGKTPRVARKIGHITSLADDIATALERATLARGLLSRL